MYIVQQAFTSVHGRYYYRGQEVSWLWYQLMASVDKRRLVKRSLYISAYEEDYRQELQERDGEQGPYFTQILAPVEEEWAPHEDFGPTKYTFPTREQAIEDSTPITDTIEETDSAQGLGEKVDYSHHELDIDLIKQDGGISQIEDSVPKADWNNDLPENQLITETIYDTTAINGSIPDSTSDYSSGYSGPDTTNSGDD